MCGITGFWRKDIRPPEEARQLAARMAGTLTHRGPDDAGCWVDDRHGLALAHRRLSIIDTSPAGHQPMLSAGARFAITFNGEIYNHQELRRQLEASGRAPPWRGHSDTETFLAAVFAWGLTTALQRVVGMFALAVWDRDQGTLHLARDRAGEKPLYYGWVGSDFVFGSELKALRAYPGFRTVVNRDVLALFMQFGNVPAPYSIFQGVRKLPPASLLTLSTDGLRKREARVDAYWSFHAAARDGLSNPIVDEREAIERLNAQLRTAVGAQMEADVPLGAFLSGGIDSSLVVSLMQEQSSRPVRTFTVGFEEPDYDESSFARAIANHLGTEHQEIRLRAEDALAVIPRIPAIYDEPFADSSQIATRLICEFASKHVKVALSGDGGDELFGGYNRYFWTRRAWNVWRHTPGALRRLAANAIDGAPTNRLDGIAAAVGLGSRVKHVGFKAQKLVQCLAETSSLDGVHRRLLTEWPAASRLVLGAHDLPSLFEVQGTSNMELEGVEHAMMMVDSVTYLPDDVLTKMDRAAMSVSLETRAPFLDHKVIEMAWQLPLRMKIRGGQGKWALRQILYGYVPRELVERPKAGFAIPLGSWLRGPLREWAEAHLSEAKLLREGYLDPGQVRTALDEHLSGRRDWTQRLWYVLTFESWLAENS